MKNYNELRAGFETAYIDGSVASSLAYRPQFVSNNYKEGKKVLSSIEDELLKCDQFQISVAFITMSGITPLLQTLKRIREEKYSRRNSYYKLSELQRAKSISKVK